VKAKPGVIAGTVVSKDKKAGIPSASVRCGAGYSTTTTTNGGYSIPNVAPGTYSCTASASGYRPSTQSVTVPTSGGTVTANFSLRR
jgi:Carboxypeptidase regulatory-like domain